MPKRAGWIVPVWVCACVAFAAQCVIFCAGISKSIEEDAPSFAQAVYPLNVTARLTNLLADIEGGNDVEGRIADIRHSLATVPDDARFYSLLGLSEVRQGREKTADTLFNAALKLSQTEQNAAINVIAASLKAQRFAEALQRSDILLRRWPDRIAGLAPALRGIAVASNDARAGLVNVLAKRPTWRSAFMSDFSSAREALPILPQVYAALEKTNGPPTDQEITLATRALIIAGQPRLAFQLYMLTRDPQERTLAGLIYNAKFQTAPNGSEFDWKVANTSGVDITIPAAAEGGAKLEFLDQPAVGAGLSQVMLLFPGDYVLSIKIEAHGLLTPEPLTASIECRSGQKLTSVKIPPGTYEQKTLALPVSVPADQCDLQILRLASVQIAPRWSKAYSGELMVREMSLAHATDE